MTTIIRKHRFFLLTLLAFLAELAMLTFWRNGFGHYASAVVFLCASLLCGMAGVWLSFRQRDHQHPATQKHPGKKKNTRAGLVSLLLAITLAIFTFLQLSQLFQQNPVPVEQSDVIPQTQVLVQRLLHHHFPYQSISFGSYALFPTYQPLQWLPFTIAELTGTDYRRLALFVLLLALLGLTVFLRRKNVTAIQTVYLAPLSFLPLLLVAIYEPSIYNRTLETLIVAYYLLLCLALCSRSAVAIAVALVGCLLSRYSVVLWIPLFFFMLLVAGERKKAATVLTICALGVVLVYVLPFLSQDSSIFWRGYQYHSAAALGEWQGQGWQQPGEKPFQLFRGLGFAGIFYDVYNGSAAEKLKAFQLLHLAFSTATVMLLGLVFYLKRKQVSMPVFALASLKIYLAVFCHFIQIPYDYLYLTLVFVSIPILWVAAADGNEMAKSGAKSRRI